MKCPNFCAKGAKNTAYPAIIQRKLPAGPAVFDKRQVFLDEKA
jgi:hypothetical protein